MSHQTQHGACLFDSRSPTKLTHPRDRLLLNRRLLSLFGLRPTGDFGPWTFYTNKQGIPVWFIKAPPTSPPTARQLFVQSRLTIFAQYWTAQTAETKMKWERASKKAGLGMTGYNLWQWWWWHKNRTVLTTIERQSGVELGV